MATSTSTSKSYTVNNSTIQYGWKCPACGAVMAPWQNTCVNCNRHFTIGDRDWYTPGITWSQTQVTCDSNPNITTTPTAYNVHVPCTPTSNISVNYKELLNNSIKKMKKNI